MMPVVAQTARPAIGQELGGRVVLNTQIGGGGGAGVNNKTRLNAMPGGGAVGAAYTSGGGAYDVRSAQMQAASSGWKQSDGGAQFVLQSL